MSSCWTIHPAPLKGTFKIPPSKSHSLRAILFASLAKGKSELNNILRSPDTEKLIEAMRQFGADIKESGSSLLIDGFHHRLQPPKKPIDCGNSGIALRFLSALSSLQTFPIVLTGDASLQRRPMEPLLAALRQLGASARSLEKEGFAPIRIRGPIFQNRARIIGEDSQFVSALLIALSFTPYPTELFVDNPGELPYIDLTLSWLDQLSIPYENQNYTSYRLFGQANLSSLSASIPGDFSSAAFLLAAALTTQSSLCIQGLDPKDKQGDRHLIEVLQQMGASIIWQRTTLFIAYRSPLQGICLDINHLIDSLPILAVLGCFAQSKTRLFNAAIARTKECDRIFAIAKELRKMGAHIEEFEDGLTIFPSTLHGAQNLDSHGDHRIAMALYVAALGAKGPSILSNVDCSFKTYPHFHEEIQSAYSLQFS